ncbi:unnamed protein product [Effrenium voratum]|uniref:Uncharacterized protein n=1 Tax=Effrenium voratum TaxID=2562239 RepID=A0AA36IMG9_9DINO|nr:unnamed protein product [Effrenium voratum]
MLRLAVARGRHGATAKHDIFCVELFAGIKTVCGGFKGCGYDATSFEVADSPFENMLSGLGCVKDHAINVDPPGELLPGQWLNSSNVLLDNRWVLKAILSLEVFRQRKPSKAELEITLKGLALRGHGEIESWRDSDSKLAMAMAITKIQKLWSSLRRKWQVGHRAKLEILLRQKAFKPRVRSDGIKVTGEATRSSGPKQCPKPTYVYSNYRMISALYLPLPSNHKWTAEMSVKYEDSCGIRRVAGGADLKKSQHYPKLFGASVAQLWVANKDRFPRWISIFSTCPKSVHAPLGHDPEGGARKTATCINT